MQLYKLNKTVLSLKKDPAQFLNGLASNTADKPQNAFLNIHGRIVVTFDQIKIDDDEIWIVIEAPFEAALMTHIDRYVALSGVAVKKLDQHVYFDLDLECDPTAGTEKVIPQKQGRLIISENNLETKVLDDTFTLFRLKNNIPMQGADYSDEFILNVGEDDFVSFTKGCFLGQEPVSKVHNRSRPSWRLVVQYEDECSEEAKEKMTSKAFDPDTDRVIGFVFIQNK